MGAIPPSLHEEIETSLIRGESQTNTHNEMSVMSVWVLSYQRIRLPVTALLSRGPACLSITAGRPETEREEDGGSPAWLRNES